MDIDREQITQVAGTIWESVLGLPIESCDDQAAAAGRTTAACVYITGAWDGAVLLDCPVDVARRAAAIMFGMDAAAVTIAELQEAVAELVNMVGGNLKALLPEKCFLSLPAAVEGGDFSSRIPGSRVAGRIAFRSEGHNVTITVREKCSRAAA